MLLSAFGPPSAPAHDLIVGRSRNGSKAGIGGEQRTFRSAADASNSRSSSGAFGAMRSYAAARSLQSALVTASSRREHAGPIVSIISSSISGSRWAAGLERVLPPG